MLIGRMLTTRNAARSRDAIRLLHGKRGSGERPGGFHRERSFTRLGVAVLRATRLTRRVRRRGLGEPGPAPIVWAPWRNWFSNEHDLRPAGTQPRGAEVLRGGAGRARRPVPLVRLGERAGERFCGECGAALEPGVGAAAEAVAPAPGVERRLVSVLFADLVGHTALSEQRDVEEVRDLLSRYATSRARSSSATAARSRSSSAMP